eukprot:scaffold21045_cov59-Phaeocystis_antarctica.AAC.7
MGILTKAHSPPLPGPLHAPVALSGQPLLGGAACSKCPSTTNNNYDNCCCCGLSLLAATHGLADSRHRSRRPPAFAQGHSIALVPARTPNVVSAAPAAETHTPLPLSRALTLYRRRAAAAARGDAGPRPLHLATLVIRGTVTVNALGR